MSIKLLTPGEKLRQIRTQYKIRQHEICGDYITRNMISMIETNKAGLTGKTAEILYDNILSLCNEKGIYCEYTLDYLTTSPERDAKVLVDDFISSLKKDEEQVLENEFLNNLKEYNYLINTFNLKKEKTELYSNIGRILKSKKDIHGAYTYYLRALDTFSGPVDDSNLSNMVFNLIYCCNKLKKYDETINYWNLINDLSHIDYPSQFTLLFNVFTAYSAMDDFNNAIGILNMLEGLTCTEESIANPVSSLNDDYAYVQVEKGMYLLEKKQYVEALNTHRNLLSKSELSTVFKIICLCNLTTIYLHLHDKKNLEYYLDKLLILIKSNVIYDHNLLGKYLPKLYSSIAKAYMYLENYTSCFEYLQRSLNVSKSLKDSDFIVDSITNLFQISISMKNKEIIDEVKTMYIELISSELIPINNPIIFSLIKYYNSIKDFDTIGQLVDFSTSKIL